MPYDGNFVDCCWHANLNRDTAWRQIWLERIFKNENKTIKEENYDTVSWDHDKIHEKYKKRLTVFEI